MSLSLRCEINTGGGVRCTTREHQLYRPPGWKHWMCWEHYQMALELNLQQERRQVVYD